MKDPHQIPGNQPQHVYEFFGNLFYQWLEGEDISSDIYQKKKILKIFIFSTKQAFET